MKKTLLAAAMLLACSAAGAQEYILNNPDNEAYLGIRASFDATLPQNIKLNKNTKLDRFDSGAGVSLGVIYNVPIIANFYIEPGINLYYNTTSVKSELSDLPSDVVDVKHNSLRQFGMRVPVMLGYHFDFSRNFNIAVFTGPELNVGFSNDHYFTAEMVNNIEYHTAPTVYGEKGYMNRVDCGWKLGVGVNFLKNYYAGVSGTFGLTNLMKNTNADGYPSYHCNAFQFTLGYNF